MDTQTLHPTATQPAAVEGAGRLDLYAGIHKALRLFMTRTLARIGSADPRDPADIAEALQQLEGLLGLCELHLKDENQFVHPALERARPGSAARIASEHEHHQDSLADLRDLAGHRARPTACRGTCSNQPASVGPYPRTAQCPPRKPQRAHAR